MIRTWGKVHATLYFLILILIGGKNLKNNCDVVNLSQYVHHVLI